jgi:O-antigen ligase
VLPDSLQTRFETIVNPEVGPANARQSGEGRIQGFFTGLELWQRNPLTGVGPGAWRPGTGSKIESHNLYGQLVGETGTLGAAAFLLLLACFWTNLRAIHRVRKAAPEWQNDLPFTLASAVGVTLLLLLFLGNFGHNLFRFNWLWFGGFLIIARHCIARRVEEDEPEPSAEEEAELPPGWVAHGPHS